MDRTTYLNERLRWILPYRGLVNHIKNPIFMVPPDETTALTGWNATSGTMEVCAGVEGLYALKITDGGVYTETDLDSGIYGLSFYAKLEATGTTYVEVAIIDLSDSSEVFNTWIYPSNTWDLFFFDDIDIPHAGDYRIRLTIPSTAPANTVFCLDMVTFTGRKPAMPFSGESEGCAWLGRRYNAKSQVNRETSTIGFIERFSEYGLFPTAIDGGGDLRPGNRFSIRFDIPGITYDETLSARTMLVHTLRSFGEIAIIADIGSRKKLLVLTYKGGLEHTVLSNGGIQGEVTAQFEIKRSLTLAPTQVIIEDFPRYQNNASYPWALFAIDETKDDDVTVPVPIYPSTTGWVHIRDIVQDVVGRVYVGGKFRLDGSATVDHGLFYLEPRDWGTPLAPANDGIQGDVYSLLRYYDTTNIIVGGNFTQLGDGTSISPAVAYYDGSAWHSMGSGLPKTVRALALWKGKVLAVYTDTDDDNKVKLYIYDFDTDTWTQETQLDYVQGYVYRMLVKDNVLHMVGDISGYPPPFHDAPIYGWVKYDLEKHEFVVPVWGRALQKEDDSPGIGYDIAMDRYGVIYVVGDFQKYGYMKLGGIVAEGRAPYMVGETNGMIRSVYYDEDTGDVYVAGDFTNIDGSPIRHVAVYQGRMWYQFPAFMLSTSGSHLGFKLIRVFDHVTFVAPFYADNYVYQGPMVYYHPSPSSVEQMTVTARGPLYNVAFRHTAKKYHIQLNGPVKEDIDVTWFLDIMKAPRLYEAYTKKVYVPASTLIGPLHLPMMFDDHSPVMINTLSASDDAGRTILTLWTTPSTLGD